MHVVRARRRVLRFCDVDSLVSPCSVCGRFFCEAHAGEGTIMLTSDSYLLCANCARLSYEEQMRVIALRRDLERG